VTQKRDIVLCIYPLIHISYQHNPIPNPTNVESSIIKEVHYFSFDDISHDTLYVQHAFMLQWNPIHSVGCNVNNHIV
jgi:hypothetical protein